MDIQLEGNPEYDLDEIEDAGIRSKKDEKARLSARHLMGRRLHIYGKRLTQSYLA